jgi:hypothetical protein
MATEVVNNINVPSIQFVKVIRDTVFGPRINYVRVDTGVPVNWGASGGSSYHGEPPVEEGPWYINVDSLHPFGPFANYADAEAFLTVVVEGIGEVFDPAA